MKPIHTFGCSVIKQVLHLQRFCLDKVISSLLFLYKPDNDFVMVLHSLMKETIPPPRGSNTALLTFFFLSSRCTHLDNWMHSNCLHRLTFIIWCNSYKTKSPKKLMCISTRWNTGWIWKTHHVLTSKVFKVRDEIMSTLKSKL